VTSLADLSCAELVHAYSSREASPIESVKACIDRIDAVDGNINAVRNLCVQSALASAKDSEERWREGKARLLEGAPFGLKDIILTAGITTTGGGRVYEDFVPDRDAAVAERLKGAGGILLAKLHTWEFAGSGIPFGQTRNPWDPAHMSGGSSSGSAAAVSAREVPLAIGTDTGGSIRAPTAFCGITALKPTFGRVSRFGVMPLSWTLDHVGPMARTVEDVATCLEVIAGYDSRDPSSGNAAVPGYRDSCREDLRDVRVGLPSNWFFEICDSEVQSAILAAADELAEAGASVQEVSIPILDEIDPSTVTWLISNPEAASLHESNIAQLDLYSDEAIARRLDGGMILAVDYLRALRLRHVIQRGLEEVFEQVDVLLTPAANAVAPRIEHENSVVEAPAVIDGDRYPWMDVVARVTSVFSLTGVPALVLPCGFHTNGLPIAMQIAGPPYGEELCFRVGHAYQARTSHHIKSPPMPIGSGGTKSDGEGRLNG
jgi:aspartyl-tRNA(Asn)/glutamyl-tRNA(Gln) amidotransferase subunit A